MDPHLPEQDALKRQAADAAVARVAPNMLLGLGTGSTVRYAIEALGRRWAAGELSGLRCLATSRASEEQARALGLQLLDSSDLPPLDLCIDGADEITPTLDLIKGLGGALLREKLVAAQAARFIVVADGSKLVDGLGQRAPLPVAVVPFGWRSHLDFLAELGAQPELRRDPSGEPVLSDDGLYHIDCRFPTGIDDPELLETQLKLRPGIVESGLFLDMASEAIVAGAGGLRFLTRS